MLRSALAVLALAASVGTAAAEQPAPKEVPTPPKTLTPPRAALPPEPLAMGWGTYPTPGGAFAAYPGMPAYYYSGPAFGYLPPRANYGPSVSPLEFPYTGPYGAYPGYAAVVPYPRTVSSYSSGPAAYPLVGRVGRRW